ncbi:MAG: hypothetical protein QW423_01220 [Candidatus Aenigmatarchaeota archaeon]
MKKGVTGEKAVFFIGAVIFLGIIFFVLFRYFPTLYNSILLNLGVVKQNDLEKAILCSIHRCLDGCMSMKVQELSWEEDGKKVNCFEKFCSDYKPSGEAVGCTCKEDSYYDEMTGDYKKFKLCYPIGCKNKNSQGDSFTVECERSEDCVREIITDTRLRICGDYYPVNIDLDKPQKVEISHLIVETRPGEDVGGIVVIKDTPLNDYSIIHYLRQQGVDRVLAIRRDSITAYGDVKNEPPETLIPKPEELQMPTIYKNMEVGTRGGKFTVYITTQEFGFPFSGTITYLVSSVKS